MLCITSHLENVQEADKLRRPDCLVVGRIEQSLEILLMEDHPSASTEPVASVFLPSGTSEAEKLRSRHELEQCDQKDWSKQDRVDRYIIFEHNIHHAIALPPPIGEFLSRTVSNADSRIAREDRMQLVGAEYGAIKLLTYLIPSHFVIWQLLGCLSSALYIVSRCGDVAQSNAINPWYAMKSRS
jgi:hypothetical protein